MQTEIEALLAALPGNVWTADADADHVTLDKALLRIGGLRSDAPDHRRWLDAVHPDDLAGGGLVWSPVSPSSAVSVATFRLLNAHGGPEVGLRALVAPAPVEAGAARHWIGTFFLDSDLRSATEHVAVAVLERIAKLAGQSEARPTTIAPQPAPDSATSRAGSAKPFAALVGCDPGDAEQLSDLLAILGWRTIVVDEASFEFFRSTHVTFVGNLALVPSEISRPYTDDPCVVLICHTERLDNMIAATSAGCRVLTKPIEIANAEELIVALS